MRTKSLKTNAATKSNRNYLAMDDHALRRVSAGRAATAALVLATALSVGLPPVAAAGQTHAQRADVQTHASQGEVRVVSKDGARLLRTGEGIHVNLDAKGLEAGHAYTMWIVAINAPWNCADAPCPSSDVMQNTDAVEADLGYGDGAIADDEGNARFAAFQPKGAMPASWHGRGLTDIAAEIHLVIRDHGPLIAGREAAMLGTFRDACNAKSVPDTLPDTARGDGEPGPYACANVQAAVFAPAD